MATTRLNFRFDPSYLLLVYPILHLVTPKFRFGRAWMSVVLIVVWSFFVNRRKRVGVGYANRLDGMFILITALFFLYTFFPSIAALFGQGRPVEWARFANELIGYSYMIPVYLSVKYCHLKELKALAFIFISGIILTALFSFVGMNAMGEGMEASRLIMTTRGKEVATLSGERIDNFITAIQYGFGSYTEMYIYALFAPIAFYAVFRARNKIVKGVLFIAFLSCVYCIRISGLSTPFVPLVIGCLSIIVVRLSKFRVAPFILGFGVLLAFLVFSLSPKAFSIFSYPFYGLGGVFGEETSLGMRLFSIGDAVSGKGTYAEFRYHLQIESLKTFVANPLFGIGTWRHIVDNFAIGKVGFHSALCDRLAFHGLVGILPYFIMMSLIVKFHRYIFRMVGIPVYEFVAVDKVLIWSLYITMYCNPTINLPAVVNLFPSFAILTASDYNKWRGVGFR